jgi:hypothetical protein
MSTDAYLTVTKHRGSSSDPISEVQLRARQGSSAASMLDVSDLTWLGQVNATGTTFSNTALAMRYVGSERRFLIAEFNGAAGSDATLGDLRYVGDLVEYAVRVNLKNGASDWTASNIPSWTETRRWKNWSTLSRLIGTGLGMGVSGIFPAMFYWVEGTGGEGWLWYSFQPIYGGGVFPVMGAVKLTDAEAGGNVSSGNIFGPYYFRSNSTYNDFKDATCGLIPIPTNRQAAMGGKFLAVGHYQAVISDYGANTVGMWVIDDLPELVTSPPAQWSVLWPSAVHLLNTGASTGLASPNMHRPPNYFGPIHGMPPCQTTYWEHGGTMSTLAGGASIGVDVDDCVYCGYDSGWIDCLAVRMSTPASGGTWAPEVTMDGTTWAEPAGWAVSNGAADLSGSENVFYWPKVQFHSCTKLTPYVGDWQYTVRLRRKTAGTSGGALRAVVGTISTALGQPYPYRDDPVGGYSLTYDATTHYGYSYMEFPWGGAWVQTSNVDGLAYFMAGSSGALWYGAAPMWAILSSTGLPVKYECPSVSEGDGYANGGKLSGPVSAWFFTWSPAELSEVIGGTRYGDNRGLNPKAYTRLPDVPAFQGIVPAESCVNVNSLYYGEPNFRTYAWGNAVIFDTSTRELMVLLFNGVNPNAGSKNILAFFQVR